MSDDRVVALTKINFVWNSHDAVVRILIVLSNSLRERERERTSYTFRCTNVILKQIMVSFSFFSFRSISAEP